MIEMTISVPGGGRIHATAQIYDRDHWMDWATSFARWTSSAAFLSGHFPDVEGPRIGWALTHAARRTGDFLFVSFNHYLPYAAKEKPKPPKDPVIHLHSPDESDF